MRTNPRSTNFTERRRHFVELAEEENSDAQARVCLANTKHANAHSVNPKKLTLPPKTALALAKSDKLSDIVLTALRNRSRKGVSPERQEEDWKRHFGDEEDDAESYTEFVLKHGPELPALAQKMIDPTASWIAPRRTAPSKQAGDAAAAAAKAVPDEAILAQFMKKNGEKGGWKLKSGTPLSSLTAEQFAEYKKLHPHAKPPSANGKGAIVEYDRRYNDVTSVTLHQVRSSPCSARPRQARRSPRRCAVKSRG